MRDGADSHPDDPNLLAYYGRALKKAGRDKDALVPLRRAFSAGNANAAVSLGVSYQFGTGVSKNGVEAARYYKIAAEAGYAQGERNLGVAYRDGLGVAPDASEAFRWFRRAYAHGSVEAAGDIGNRYRRGFPGQPPSKAKALRWYFIGARRGDAGAQYSLALDYWRIGNSTWNDKQPFRRAARYFRLAARQGHADAQTYLGNMYYTGSGVEQSHEEAARWYSAAAEQADPNAMYNLAALYKNGEGVTRSLDEAATWFHRAAEQTKEADTAKVAALRLAELYASKESVIRDDTKAVRWYTVLAERHADPDAMLTLLRFAAEGRGQVASAKRAAEWATRRLDLVDRNDASARAALGKELFPVNLGRVFRERPTADPYAEKLAPLLALTAFPGASIYLAWLIDAGLVAPTDGKGTPEILREAYERGDDGAAIALALFRLRRQDSADPNDFLTVAEAAKGALTETSGLRSPPASSIIIPR